MGELEKGINCSGSNSASDNKMLVAVKHVLRNASDKDK